MIPSATSPATNFSTLSPASAPDASPEHTVARRGGDGSSSSAGSRPTPPGGGASPAIRYPSSASRCTFGGDAFLTTTIGIAIYPIGRR